MRSARKQSNGGCSVRFRTSLVLLTVRWSVVAWYPNDGGYVYDRAKLRSVRLPSLYHDSLRKICSSRITTTDRVGSSFAMPESCPSCVSTRCRPTQQLLLLLPLSVLRHLRQSSNDGAGVPARGYYHFLSSMCRLSGEVPLTISTRETKNETAVNHQLGLNVD